MRVKNLHNPQGYITLELREEVDEEIIINHQFKYSLSKHRVSYPTIEIYDDYRE